MQIGDNSKETANMRMDALHNTRRELLVGAMTASYMITRFPPLTYFAI